MASEAQADCVVCGKPAYNKCGGCKSDTSSHHYCGKARQAEDWPSHKNACRNIQNVNLGNKLARVAGIIQQAYYDFRKNTWDIPVSRIEDRNATLVMHYGKQNRNGNYFKQFPQHLTAKERTKKAMLCEFVCNEPLAWVHSIIGELLKDSDIKIEEVRVHLHNPVPRTVIVYHETGEPSACHG